MKKGVLGLHYHRESGWEMFVWEKGQKGKRRYDL